MFFSVLLQNFPGIALENFKNLREGGLIPFFDSFAGHMHSGSCDYHVVVDL